MGYLPFTAKFQQKFRYVLLIMKNAFYKFLTDPVIEGNINRLLSNYKSFSVAVKIGILISKV